MSDSSEEGDEKWVHVNYLVPVTESESDTESDLQTTALEKITSGAAEPAAVDVTDTDEWPNTQTGSAESSSESDTLYAIVNTDNPYLESQLVITNETATTNESSVGSRPAIYHDIEIAKAQLAIQRATFGEDHLKLVRLEASGVDEQAEPAADGSMFDDEHGVIEPDEDY